MNHHDQDRRNFLRAGATIAAATVITPAARRASGQEKELPSEKIVVGVMGVNGRGKSIARGMTLQPNVEVAYICDVDERAAATAAKLIESTQQGKTPTIVSDFRRVLDDPQVDALACAAPNHWHAPAAILGCKAEKHVYVEKPCSHTPHEGEVAIVAARRFKRVVQVGTQRRSWPAIAKGIEKIHNGEVGKPLYARTWYNSRRGPIGRGKTRNPAGMARLGTMAGTSGPPSVSRQLSPLQLALVLALG